MALDLKKMEEDFEKWINSEEGKLHFEKLALLDSNAKKWETLIIKRITKLTDEEFDQLMGKFFIWEEKFERRYWKRYIEANSNLMDRLFDVFATLGEIFDSNEDFYSQGYIYRGYIFKLFCGQGCFYRIEKNKKIVHQSL